MNPPPHTDPAARPAIAIVGRPNVGKSAIFNRIVGRRTAIVHEESGVTRDRLVCEAQWNAKRFDLADTGGIEDPAAAAGSDQIRAGIERQTALALETAAAAIFVVDAPAGPLPLDAVVAGWLRKRGVKVVVAANKCDHPGRDDDAAVFERFGFPVFPVSALHNRGIGALLDEATRDLPAILPDAGAPPLRVAVVGRPNVGKSSYINRLLRSERVIVADLPGTTRDSIDIPFALGAGPAARRYVLTDTAGIRQKRRIDTAVERFSLMRAEQSIARADVCVLLLDAAQGPTAQDKKIAALIRQEAKGCVIVANKWDRFDGVSTQREYLPALYAALPFLAHVPVVFCSARSGFNIRRTVEAIDQVATEIARRLPTGVLNRVLANAWARTAPPLVQGRRLKLFYATQVGAQPLRIALFVNDPGCWVPAYGAYLVAALRAAFGLEGAPVILAPQQRRGRAAAAGGADAADTCTPAYS
jgi:GTP-binding protein